METLEKEILEAMRQQPEWTPEGKIWRFHWGGKAWTRAYILENWDRDEEMRKSIVEAVLALKLHRLGRGPPE